MRPVRAYLPWSRSFSSTFEQKADDDHAEDPSDEPETTFLYVPLFKRATPAQRTTVPWPNNVFFAEDKDTCQSKKTEIWFVYVMYTPNDRGEKPELLHQAQSGLMRGCYTVYSSSTSLDPWRGIVIQVQIPRRLDDEAICRTAGEAAWNRLKKLKEE
ncbi:hypothetical protein BDV59DRAFT_200413 [Aspergillus ambiguus]|uniref:uncharacterized protein n=1 Tax=Aspergillus ambiguus TaxID=176160 RepID=UPI003CCC988E